VCCARFRASVDGLKTDRRGRLLVTILVESADRDAAVPVLEVVNRAVVVEVYAPYRNESEGVDLRTMIEGFNPDQLDELLAAANGEG
jgi:hypothetical protein